MRRSWYAAWPPWRVSTPPVTAFVEYGSSKGRTGSLTAPVATSTSVHPSGLPLSSQPSRPRPANTGPRGATVVVVVGPRRRVVLVRLRLVVVSSSGSSGGAPVEGASSPSPPNARPAASTARTATAVTRPPNRLRRDPGGPVETCCTDVIVGSPPTISIGGRSSR